MTIKPIAEQECREILTRAKLGRLGCCLDDEPYVIPVYLAYEGKNIYVFSTHGQKIDWMRTNPRACVQIDEIVSHAEWVSVIVHGKYEELVEPRFSSERTHARELLESRHEWWLNAMAERRTQVRDTLIEPLFFRIHIDAISGLRASAEAETP